MEINSGDIIGQVLREQGVRLEWVRLLLLLWQKRAAI